jgi:hypothetical protein
MTVSPSSSDLDALSLIRKIDSGELARDFVMLIARGFLPLPQEELVTVLVHLASSTDAEVAELSRVSLKELPPRVVLDFARNQLTQPAMLDTLADAVSDPMTLEAVLRNRATTDETVARLAGRVKGNLLEIIVVNQERILRSREILDQLLANPDLTTDVRRRAMELHEEFFVKAQPKYAPVEPEEEPLTEEQQAELDLLLAEARAMDENAPAVVEEAAPPEEIAAEADADSAWRRIAKMTVAQKVQCAFRGGLTERSILIRERNKLICTAVIRSPRLTENEAETYAGMRNIEEEVLRIIGMKRDWMAKYGIMLALIRNPKAPIGVVLPLINRLTLRDLKSLQQDKGVSETVRQTAKRLYVQRQHR